jgi:hypothetical protein
MRATDQSMAALAALMLVAGCGAAPEATAARNEAAQSVNMVADTIVEPPPVQPTPTATADCEPDAPESPCPIVGRWRIARVYVPDAADPLADDRGMIGVGLTVTANGDAPGALKWDGPDTGQFDISDVCTGPYLTPRGTPAGDPAAAATLKAALAAWKVTGDPAAARALGCDSGQWTVPTDPAGERYGLVLPMGDRAAIQWYEGRFLLLERAG